MCFILDLEGLSREAFFFVINMIHIFPLWFDKLGEKFIFITLEFFCVAYLLLIIDVPSSNWIIHLPSLQNLLKFTLHSALLRLRSHLKNPYLSMRLILLDGGVLRWTRSAECCRVLLEMVIFGCERTVGVVVR